MTASPEARQLLLLDLLSPMRDVDRNAFDRLDAADWEHIQSMARGHRLTPLLHWRLTHEKAHLSVPEAIHRELAEDFRASTMRALAIQREIVLVHRILEDG